MVFIASMYAPFTSPAARLLLVTIRSVISVLGDAPIKFSGEFTASHRELGVDLYTKVSPSTPQLTWYSYPVLGSGVDIAGFIQRPRTGTIVCLLTGLEPAKRPIEAAQSQ